MAYERNDIVTKNRLMGELGEGLMGFEHNDIVTVDKMNEAIAEGGGGGGDFTVVEMTITVTGSNGADIQWPMISESFKPGGASFTAGESTVGLILYQDQSAGFEVFDLDVENSYPASAMTGTGNINIDETGYVTVTGDCTLTVNTDA